MNICTIHLITRLFDEPTDSPENPHQLKVLSSTPRNNLQLCRKKQLLAILVSLGTLSELYRLSQDRTKHQSFVFIMLSTHFILYKFMKEQDIYDIGSNNAPTHLKSEHLMWGHFPWTFSQTQLLQQRVSIHERIQKFPWCLSPLFSLYN